jgi:hypothetical protein
MNEKGNFKGALQLSKSSPDTLDDNQIKLIEQERERANKGLTLFYVEWFDKHALAFENFSINTDVARVTIEALDFLEDYIAQLEDSDQKSRVVFYGLVANAKLGNTQKVKSISEVLEREYPESRFTQLARSLADGTIQFTPEVSIDTTQDTSPPTTSTVVAKPSMQEKPQETVQEKPEEPAAKETPAEEISDEDMMTETLSELISTTDSRWIIY